MASLELVDHTQELQCWRLPRQQHGALRPAASRKREPVGIENARSSAKHPAGLTAE